MLNAKNVGYFNSDGQYVRSSVVAVVRPVSGSWVCKSFRLANGDRINVIDVIDWS